jgi:putative spermidine/putrescine transport system permease protein
MLLGAFVFPLLVMASRSVVTETGFSLANYLEIATDPRYVRSFLFTTCLGILSTLLALLLCVPIAFFLEQHPTQLNRLAAVALTLPLSLPGVVIGFFIILGFGRTGVVTELLEGLTTQRNPQLAFTFWGLLMGYVYFQIPRVILVLRGAMSNLQNDTLNVAQTLGLPPLNVFLRVVLPSLLPAIINASSLSLATAYGAFGTAATLSRGLRVIPLEIAALFTERFQPERAATLSILLGVLTISLMLLLPKGRRAT